MSSRVENGAEIRGREPRDRQTASRGDNTRRGCIRSPSGGFNIESLATLGSPVVTYVATLIEESRAGPFSYDRKEGGEGERRTSGREGSGGWKVIGCVSS
jgi:hypothetical protein